MSDPGAVNVIAIWKRDGVIYSLGYDGWGSSPKHAPAKLMTLVSALPPVS